MARENLEAIKSQVQRGKCILKGCDNDLGSRGLCDHHRQRWYRELRKMRSEEERIEFEEASIRLGLILAPREQEEWIGELTNPFAEAKPCSTERAAS